jgi:hypothetical protein
LKDLLKTKELPPPEIRGKAGVKTQ